MTTPVPDRRRLAFATLAALGVAGVALVVAVLPAEHGVDPTGLGAAFGFARLHEGAAPVVGTPATNGTAPLYELRATWRLLSFPLAEREGRVTPGDAEERVVVPLRVANLTSVTATLRWNDTDTIEGRPTQGDTLEISIRGPRGVRSQLVQATNAPGEPGNASVTVNLLSVPFPQENATGGILFPSVEDTSGVGNWTFIVRLYAAGGIEGSDGRDPGENWTLTVTGEAYELDVRKQAGRAGDRVRLTLAPGHGVEYKFAMRPGATMSYRWEATGPVHSDLHGDRADDPENFTSARIGSLVEDEGDYTAPFEGRHGWYWRNDGRSTVTITLETTGDYAILGVVA